MDMALECLASSSGRHHQKYVLVAPELTRATSRWAVSDCAALTARYGMRGVSSPVVQFNRHQRGGGGGGGQGGERGREGSSLWGAYC